MHGCFYHLCSNMWKRIQQSGLQERYINDPEFALHLRMISALAFLPPNDVQNSFDQLAALIRNQYGNMEFWTTSRIIMVGGSVSMLQEVHQHFQSIFGICFTAQLTSFQEQITQLRGATEGSKHMFLPVILRFGSFLKSYKRRKLFSEWEFYKMKVVTNFLHKEDTLIATSVSSKLSMTSQIVKELII